MYSLQQWGWMKSHINKRKKKSDDTVCSVFTIFKKLPNKRNKKSDLFHTQKQMDCLVF